MGWLCDYASEFGANWKEGRQIFHYNIEKNKLIELIDDGTITFELEELEFLGMLLKKDNAQ